MGTQPPSLLLGLQFQTRLQSELFHVSAFGCGLVVLNADGGLALIDNVPTIEAYDGLAHKRVEICRVSQQCCAYSYLSSYFPSHRYPDVRRRSLCVMHPLPSKVQLLGWCGLRPSRETVRMSFVQCSNSDEPWCARGRRRDGLPVTFDYPAPSIGL